MLKINLYISSSLFLRGLGDIAKKNFFSDNSLTIEIQNGMLVVGN